jgi:hypothetical protein
VYGFFVLRPRDVRHPTSKVYHVPRQAVLTALPQSDVDRQIQLGKVQGALGFDDFSEPLFFFFR